MIANVAAEIDIRPNWSITLPIYYSGIDYFASHTKFRTFTIQPEARYWFDDKNMGLFVGAHLGLGYYNFATRNNWRIQDKDGNSPAWGGGVSIGYRMPITRNGRLSAEFTLGAGVYDARYDKFHNEPQGFIVHSEHRTFFGIDNAAVSVVYRFNIKRSMDRR